MDDRELASLENELEAVPVPAAITDLRTGMVIAVNSAVAELLGSPASELIGIDAVSRTAPADQASAAAGHAAIADGTVDGLQVAHGFIRSDGSVINVAVWGRRISANEQLALWTLTPATPGLRAGGAGRVPDLVLAVTDHDWVLEYVSADAQLLGAPERGLIGMPLLGLVHPSVAIEFLTAAAHAVANRRSLSINTRLRAPSGEWTDRYCLLAPMCHHEPPRLGVVIAAPDDERDKAPEGLSAHVRSAVLDARGARALGALAQIRRADLPALSARQVEVLAGVIEGKGVADIAAAAYLSPSTVRNHLSTIYRKFGVHSRAELLAALLRSQ